MKTLRQGLWRSPTSVDHLKQLTRYVVVGSLSAAAHLAIAGLLMTITRLGPTVASSLAFVAVAAGAFVAHHSWVFRSLESPRSTAFRYSSVASIAFLVNLTTVHVGTSRAGLPYFWVQVVAFILIPIANYLAHKFWSFRARST